MRAHTLLSNHRSGLLRSAEFHVGRCDFAVAHRIAILQVTPDSGVRVEWRGIGVMSRWVLQTYTPVNRFLRLNLKLFRWLILKDFIRFE